MPAKLPTRKAVATPRPETWLNAALMKAIRRSTTKKPR